MQHLGIATAASEADSTACSTVPWYFGLCAVSLELYSTVSTLSKRRRGDAGKAWREEKHV